ncbi:phage tail protein [Streptomyces sp. NPDC093085]|uniref:phage tail protein n=1 Tax=Streptomyces sp. NPDC093085 TaxID=3155068 RepID=UPI0034306EBD
MLPESIPTVTVTARYLTPDGTPMTGQVEFRPPTVLTHAEADLFLGGPTRAPLDSEGAISVVLPATDAPGWNPEEWAYTVTEKLGGLTRPRAYRIVLAAGQERVDLADLAPADPATPNYVAVRGPAGPAGEPGEQGPPGEPGAVRSVNGHTVADIALTAADVAALPAASAGARGGVATLGADGLVPAGQLPAGTGGGVASVNGRTGTVVLAAADLGALDPAAADLRYLRLGGAPVTSVNEQTGEVALTAADVGAVRAGDALLLDGDQTVRGTKSFAAPPATTVNPTTADQLTRRGYVDAVTPAGTWSPASVGFSGWAFDPAAGSGSTVQYCVNGWVYLIGIPLHAATTVRNVVFYVPGYAGTGLGATSFAGLYTAAGARIGLTAALPNLIKGTSGETVVCPLTSAYSAAPGNYWVALLINGPSPSTNGPAFLRGSSMGETPGGSARMPGSFIRHGRLSVTGQTSLPASFTPSTVVADSNAVWAALS